MTMRAHREDLPSLDRLRRERDGKVPVSWKPKDAGTHVPQFRPGYEIDPPEVIAARRRALLED